MDAEFAAAVPLLTSVASGQWARIQARYRYDDDVSKVEVFAQDEGSPRWRPVSYGEFDLLDVFDGYREKHFPDDAPPPWGKIVVTVERRGGVSIDFAAGDTDIFAVDPDAR